MTRLTRWIEFTAKTPILLTTAFIAVMLLVVMFPALPIGGELLDARFGYTHAEVVDALAVYGADGRHVYLWASLTLDTLLPVAYAALLAGLVYRLRPKDRLGALSIVPLAAGVLDLGENAQIAAMLVGYPDVSRVQVAVASLFTQAKVIALLASLALVGTLVVLAVLRRIWRRHDP